MIQLVIFFCIFVAVAVILIIDAFTRNHFTGNPAGVCLMNKAMPAKNMQLIAREINL
ncbi:MAG: PhzF family phenazine biosynthesis protein, partial [Candidatus Hodarchaeales archaeon]